MAVEHITDDDIQVYLDALHDNKPVAIKVTRHLKNCQVCQSRVTQYRRLYELLAVDEGYDVSPGFAEKIVSSVTANTTGELNSTWGIVLLVVGFCIGLGATAYFVDITILATNMIEPFTPLYTMFGDLIDLIQWDLLQQRHVGVYIATGVILLFVAVGDRVLFRLKDNRYCL